MEGNRLSPKYRLRARSSKNLVCGVELPKYHFYAYLKRDTRNGYLNCYLFLGANTVILQSKFATKITASQNLLDLLVRLARYTITTPTTNEQYLEWRDTSESKAIDKILDRYEQDYADAIINLYNGYYRPIAKA